jgi:hypothetical protein
MADDDDHLELAPDTLKALQEFYAERHRQEQHEERLRQMALQTTTTTVDSTDQHRSSAATIEENFSEDWQLSQFWV